LNDYITNTLKIDGDLYICIEGSLDYYNFYTGYNDVDRNFRTKFDDLLDCIIRVSGIHCCKYYINTEKLTSYIKKQIFDSIMKGDMKVV